MLGNRNQEEFLNIFNVKSLGGRTPSLLWLMLISFSKELEVQNNSSSSIRHLQTPTTEFPLQILHMEKDPTESCTSAPSAAFRLAVVRSY